MNVATLLRVSLTVFTLSALVAHAAPINKWTDANGKTHYGTQPPAGTQSTGINKAPAGNPSSETQKEEVILYSTAWCGYCKKARAYLTKNGIAYTELDIEKDRFARAAYERAGGVGVPFLVKGKNVLPGFRSSSYDRFFTAE